MSKERPILFSGPMVRAILEGRKTQTRRIMKPQPETNSHGLLIWSRGGNGGQLKEHNFRELIPNHCPYGQPGDLLWVRETWAHYKLWQRGPDGYGRAVYKADGDERGKSGPFDSKDKWRPSIHMPRWASRITLEVVSVRVERLQDISGKDAEAEGVERCDNPDHELIYSVGGEISRLGCPGCGGDPDGEAIKGYRDLWQSINGPGSWEANPWVWVVEFKRINP